MKKRFLALLLAALTVLSLLTGCGGSKSDTETPSTPMTHPPRKSLRF